jgi:hypothetical protein
VKKSRYTIPLVASLAVIVAVSPYFSMIAYANPPDIPSSIQVAVSYGDTERNDTCSNCFPSPWCGSPGVQFVGSSTNYNGNPTDATNCAKGDWDTGGVLVANTGADSITLTGLTVALPLPLSGSPGSPTCGAERRPITIDVWFGQQYYYGNHSDPAYFGGPITIPAGGQAIFAGTTSDGTYRCPSGNYPSGPSDGTYDFDASDAYFLGGCTPTTDTVSAPQVTFSATGYAATTYIDAGHAIDTGGIDTGNCSHTAANPEWPNESLGWRLASSVCGESCPTNQFEAPATTSTGALTTTSTVPSSATTASTTASTIASSTASTAAMTTSATSAAATAPVSGTSAGVGATTLYLIAAVAVIISVAAGFFAQRLRKAAT